MHQRLCRVPRLSTTTFTFAVFRRWKPELVVNSCSTITSTHLELKWEKQGLKLAETKRSQAGWTVHMHIAWICYDKLCFILSNISNVRGERMLLSWIIPKTHTWNERIICQQYLNVLKALVRRLEIDRSLVHLSSKEWISWSPLLKRPGSKWSVRVWPSCYKKAARWWNLLQLR